MLRNIFAVVLAALLTFSPLHLQAQSMAATATYNVRQISNDREKPPLSLWNETWTVIERMGSYPGTNYGVLGQVGGDKESKYEIFFHKVEEFRWTFLFGEELGTETYKFVIGSIIHMSQGSSVGHVIMENKNGKMEIPIFIEMKELDPLTRILTIRFMFSNGIWITQERKYDVRTPYFPDRLVERVIGSDQMLINEILRIRTR